jgi:hypothetical protein
VRALALAWPDRLVLGEVWRELRDAGAEARGTARWRAALCGAAPRSPEAAARALRVLCETGVARTMGDGLERGVEAVSSVRGELRDSPSFAAYREAYEECHRYLSRSAAPNASAKAA